MAVAWHVSLANTFLVDDYAEEPPDNVIWNETLSGRFKSQLVSTQNSRPIQGSVILKDLTEKATFETWYRDTAIRGTQPFQNLYFNGVNYVWQFIGKPRLEPYQGAATAFICRMSLLRLPDAPV